MSRIKSKISMNEELNEEKDNVVVDEVVAETATPIADEEVEAVVTEEFHKMDLDLGNVAMVDVKVEENVEEKEEVKVVETTKEEPIKEEEVKEEPKKDVVKTTPKAEPKIAPKAENVKPCNCTKKGSKALKPDFDGYFSY